MSTQQPDPAGPGGGGGKIATTKRRWRFNPYNRPTPPPPAQQSPKLISQIASGAVKILSSVFISDSSSSDSSDQEAFPAEADVDSDNGGYQNRTNGSNLEAESFPQVSKELGAGLKETGRKDAIVQLLLQETFSREECDELVKIVKSRVLEHTSVDTGKVADSAPIPRSIVNVSADQAVMEARKFLQEKKVGRSPQSDFGGLCSAMIQHVGEVESPADMAKSYMQTRPPWASHSIDRFELTTPSTLIKQLTSEEKLHSASPLKARNVFAFGAWSMQDEIRRVRSKATEDMLRPLSSSKADQSLLSPVSRSCQINGVTVPIPGDQVYALSSSVETKTEDQSAKLAAGADSID